MIEKLLSVLFPVRLPRGTILEHVRVHTGDFTTVEGEGVGTPKPKRYRDAIERHWKEEEQWTGF